MEIIINGESLEVKLVSPKQSQVFELDKFYRMIFSECIRGGIMSEAEAKKRHEESGAWTKEDDKRIEDLIKMIAFNSARLSDHAELTEDTADICASIQDDRSTMFDLISRRTDLMSNTAEGMANEQRVFKYVSLCLCTEEGYPIFSTEKELEDFSESDPEGFSSVMTNAYAEIYGLDKDANITEGWAEVEFLERVQAEGDKEEKKTKTKAKAKTKKKKSSKDKK